MPLSEAPPPKMAPQYSLAGNMPLSQPPITAVIDPMVLVMAEEMFFVNPFAQFEMAGLINPSVPAPMAATLTPTPVVDPPSLSVDPVDNTSYDWGGR